MAKKECKAEYCKEFASADGKPAAPAPKGPVPTDDDDSFDTASETGTFKQLLTPAGPLIHHTTGSKVTVVGSGMVGMACVVSLLTMKVASQVCIVDMAADKVRGEMLDLQHGSMFLGDVKVHGSDDYSMTANSRICVVTAGVRQKEGESRLDLVKNNTEVLRAIIPELVKYSPDTILMIVSNPCDILAYVSWKLSGLPAYRVMASGTNLDSSRFRFLMSQRFNSAPTSCHGWVIGEHGDSSVPVWSGINIAGVRLRDLNPTIGSPEDPENWESVHERVVNSAAEIIKLKGYTNWGIGLSVASMCNAIIRNSGTVHAVATMIKGHHGIEQEVFLSLPCVLGENGVSYIIKQTLTDDEKGKLQKSADAIWNVQKDLQI